MGEIVDDMEHAQHYQDMECRLSNATTADYNNSSCGSLKPSYILPSEEDYALPECNDSMDSDVFISPGGKILVQFTYVPTKHEIQLTLIRLAEMPSPERGGSYTVKAHLCLLPTKQQRYHSRTVYTQTGILNETFRFRNMTIEGLKKSIIRVRIYATKVFGLRKRIVGEIELPLSQLDVSMTTVKKQTWKTLTPRGMVVSIDRHKVLC